MFTESNIFAVLHTTNGSIAWRRSFADGGVKSYRVLPLPDGDHVLLAVTRPAGNSVLYRASWVDGSLDWELSTSSQISALDFIGDATLVGETSGDVHIVKHSGTKQFTISNEGATIVAIKSGKIFAEKDETVTISKIDVNGQSLVEAARFEGTFVSVEGDILVLRKADSHIVVKLDENFQTIDSITESDVDSIIFDDSIIVSKSASGTVTVYDRESLGELNHIEIPVVAVAVGSETETFTTINFDNELNVINSATNAAVFTFKLTVSAPVLAVSAVGENTLVRYSNGIIQLLSGSRLLWERDESIAANPIAGLFIQLPQTAAVDTAAGIREEILLDEGSNSNLLLAYIKRVSRHLSDLQALPHYIIRKLQSSYMAVDEVELDRANEFGLHQYFVIVSGRTGRVVALDTFLKGKTVWALDGVDVGAENGKDTTVWLFGSSVYIFTKTGAVTVINALTGKIIKTDQILPADQILFKVIELPSGLYVWTSTDELIAVDGTPASVEIYYSYRVNDDSVWGYTISANAEGKMILTKTWEFNLDHGYIVAETASRPKLDKTINVGQVLEDRRVLYKYLHANMLSVAATNAEEHRLQVFLLDTVTGRILHAKTHETVDTAFDIALAQGEHWLVYTYTALAPTLGEQLTMWDLYESNEPNTRTHADEEYSSFDGLLPAPYVLHKSFFTGLSSTAKLGLTVTKHGITVRDVLLLTHSNQLFEYSKPQLLSPTTTALTEKGKNKTTQVSAKSFYDNTPTLLSKSQKSTVLTHNLPLILLSGNNNNILVTGPTALESTALVAAAGNDVFVVRVTPSKPFDVLNTIAFSKQQLIYTVATMLVVVGYLRPQVGKKRANTKWGVE